MRDKLRAVTLAGVLVGWSAVAPRIPSRWHPAPHAAFGTAAAALARAPLGLRPPALWAGLRGGASAAAPVLLAVAAATATPPVRGGM
ncbi:CPBP family intramembrane metalloprotease, partial [Mycobacterium pyrenivorans]|nr:CPBP family intramembrane metalloprotease [Mycolicibacterium pyrenivorans]